jgi:mannose-1-phosphate guanylyltransferase/phosphomannomutase
LGDDVIVGEGATIAPDVKVYPHKTIEAGANVTQSLIYETMGLRTIFKGGVVTGKFNVNLTPEFVTRLSSSFGTTLDPGAVVTLGRDSSRGAQVAKRAMTAALLGTGIHIRDLRAAHAGVVRHDVLSGRSSAGAHVRAGADPDDVEILFFASDATPMTEGDQRSVEKAFVREEYRRAHGEGIGELIYPGRVVEQFVERLERVVDREKTAGATIVVDFFGGVAGLVASRVFSRLGVGAVVMEGFANANVVSSGPGVDVEESIERVARIVPTVGAVFGAVVGPEAEVVRFVDDEGRLVPDDVMLACLIKATRPRKAVFPINLSTGYRELAEAGGGTVEISRTGIGSLAIKAANVARGPRLSGRRPLHLPLLPPGPRQLHDARPRPGGLPLRAPLRRAPRVRRALRRRRARAPGVPLDGEGRVMRGLAERFGGDPDAILTEGVRLSVDGGWVLMLPDPDNPVFYVYAEPGNGGDPHALAGEYVDLVRSLIEEGAASETSS